MRGADIFTESLFTMRRLDDFVPENHPLRSVRKMVNQALKNIEPLLSGMYATDIKGGRPSIAPEKLLESSQNRRLPPTVSPIRAPMFIRITASMTAREEGNILPNQAQLLPPVLTALDCRPHANVGRLKSAGIPIHFL